MAKIPVVSLDADGDRTRAVADAAVELLTRAPVPVVSHDADLTVTGWNAAAERCFGFTAEEIVGRSLVGILLDGEAAAAWRAGLAAPGDAVTLACARKAGGQQRCAWTLQAIAGEEPRWLAMGQPIAGPSLDERLFGAVLDNLPISIWVVDRRGDYVFHDGLGVAQLGIQRRSWVGLNLWEMWKGVEGTTETLRQVRVAMDSAQQTHAFAEAMGLHWETWCVPLKNEDGEVDLVVSTTMDITAHRRAESELQARIEQIEEQQKLIKDLATPIIEVWEGVLTAPLTGVLDGERATEMMQRLLGEVVRVRARHAILDLTGVEQVDERTAAYLVELVRAIRLLGAEAIITGVRPQVAQIFVSLGADLTAIPIRSNLRSGLEYCMRKPRAGAGARTRTTQ
jgi:rsbT co-antagonist protein RsbR